MGCTATPPLFHALPPRPRNVVPIGPVASDLSQHTTHSPLLVFFLDRLLPHFFCVLHQEGGVMKSNNPSYTAVDPYPTPQPPRDPTPTQPTFTDSYTPHARQAVTPNPP